MKLTVTLALCLVGLVFVAAEPENVRGHNRRNRAGRIRLKQERGNGNCKYFRKGEMSECDPVTQTKSVTFHLKKGENCPPNQIYRQPCGENDNENINDVKGCKYERRAEWSECGPGVLTRRKMMNLKPGQPTTCPSVRTKTVPCRSGRKGKNKAKKLKKKKGKGGKMCKYLKGAWSECDAATNTRTRELTLKKGDESICLPRKTIRKKCKKPCKYYKGTWAPCNEATNMKERQLTLKKGDPSVCNATMTISKPCRRRDAFTAAKTSQCKYKASEWGECDERTNTMRRVLQLKSGDPDLCQQSKQLTRKCRKPCKFSKGTWSDCDEKTKLKTRTDTLLKGNPTLCEATRVMTAECGKNNECKYEIGDWGECDPNTKARKRIKQLVKGDPQKCQREMVISRACHKPNGEESCFLGPWGEYGPCLNGVMMKHRPVIAGGMQCERKAVKAKPCS